MLEFEVVSRLTPISLIFSTFSSLWVSASVSFAVAAFAVTSNAAAAVACVLLIVSASPAVYVSTVWRFPSTRAIEARVLSNSAFICRLMTASAASMRRSRKII